MVIWWAIPVEVKFIQDNCPPKSLKDGFGLVPKFSNPQYQKQNKFNSIPHNIHPIRKGSYGIGNRNNLGVKDPH